MIGIYKGRNLQMIGTFWCVGLGVVMVLEERSLEIGEVLRGRQEAGLHIFWKKVRESLSRLSDNECKLATNKMLGYDMPRVKLNMIIGYCSFLD